MSAGAGRPRRRHASARAGTPPRRRRRSARRAPAARTRTAARPGRARRAAAAIASRVVRRRHDATSTGSSAVARVGAPGQRALAPVRARLRDQHRARPPRARAAAIVQQPARAGADDEQHVARRAGPTRSWARSAQASGSEHVAATGSSPSSGEQLADELALDPHALGEAAGVQPGGPELRAQRLVPGGADAAGAARGVVMDRDHVARPPRRSTPSPTSTTSPTGSCPSTAGSLRAHVPAVDVGAAGGGGEHAADHLARPAGRRGHVNDRPSSRG